MSLLSPALPLMKGLQADDCLHADSNQDHKGCEPRIMLAAHLHRPRPTCICSEPSIALLGLQVIKPDPASPVGHRGHKQHLQPDKQWVKLL